MLIMNDLYIAFVWHMHQPLYHEPHSQRFSMPWVRLHGVKDYLDMVAILRDYPEIQQTFNLVPALFEQLNAYATGTAIDPYLQLSQIPPSELTLKQRVEIIERFFDLNWPQMIHPYPRYKEILDRRTQLHDHYHHYGSVAEEFEDQEILDLTMLFNLAWMDPFLHEDYPRIAELKEKGRDFTLEERKELLELQREIIAEIIPTYKKFLNSQQIELSTTPYYHPILPLLVDTNSALRATPHIEVPDPPFAHPEDAAAQLWRGKQAFHHYFQQSPRGLWPSEQALSPEVLPLIAKQGFEWLASSEGILWHSLNHTPHRNASQLLTEPEILYKPYQLNVEGTQLNIVFRDIHLSDLIGFQYWKGDNRQGARHFYQQLKGIQESLQDKEPYPYLVTIALDGENCWEFYKNDGLDFLRELYGLLSQDKSLKCVKVSDYLDKFPPQNQLNHLHTGSWIGSNLTTWIGDPIKNKAWKYLGFAREALIIHEHLLPDEPRNEAWTALFMAEGSDWFWWFGKGHSSAHDAVFDWTFRAHLKTIYQLIDLEVPDYLNYPLDDSVQSNTSAISTMQSDLENYHTLVPDSLE